VIGVDFLCFFLKKSMKEGVAVAAVFIFFLNNGVSSLPNNHFEKMKNPASTGSYNI
jgi:hypothetical protein